MNSAENLYVTSRHEWRNWLLEHQVNRKAVWLIFYKKHTGKLSISYDDAVEEALCFGWIDSIIKRIDDEKFARKFTPRKSKSRWSELNKKRVRMMIKAGKMTEAGMKTITEAKKSGEWSKQAATKKELTIPSFINKALAENKKALEFFNSLANSYKRNIVGWIGSAKREDTRKRRLAEAIKLLEENKKLGMK